MPISRHAALKAPVTGCWKALRTAYGEMTFPQVFYGAAGSLQRQDRDLQSGS